jgi:hypothetical protein
MVGQWYGSNPLRESMKTLGIGISLKLVLLALRQRNIPFITIKIKFHALSLNNVFQRLTEQLLSLAKMTLQWQSAAILIKLNRLLTQLHFIFAKG